MSCRGGVCTSTRSEGDWNLNRRSRDKEGSDHQRIFGEKLIDLESDFSGRARNPDLLTYP